MNTNPLTGTTLAADILDRLIQLDALLELAATDEQDKAELAARLTALDASEIRHILNLLLERGIVLESAVAIPDTAAEEASQSHV